MIIYSCYNKIDKTISIMTKNGSIAELCQLIQNDINGDVFYFNRIKGRPEFQGTGEGKEIMIEICRYANQLNVIIYNELNPYGKRNLESLKNFFKASGFEMFKEPNVMIRKPTP